MGRMLAADVVRRTYEENVDHLMLLCFSEQLFDETERITFLRRQMLANPYPQRPEGFARQAEASGRHEARERLGSLGMPVHVIGAGHDILVPAWKSEELAELIPGAKLTIIEGAPHGLNLERPDADQDRRAGRVVYRLEHGDHRRPVARLRHQPGREPEPGRRGEAHEAD